jgi:hypothetical protein
MNGGIKGNFMRIKMLLVSFCVCLSLTMIGPKVEAQVVSDQIIGDLITVGISGAATLTGNIPLALASGVLSKYISTYGVMAVKSVVNKMKAHPPHDLGEINIYFIYLIHVKRNLYQALINMRTNVQNDNGLRNILREIEQLEQQMLAQCDGSCSVEGLDESLINFEFLNIALEAKQSYNIFEYINAEEVKLNYQYLMLLYLDVIIIEQKLLEAQYNVLATQISELTAEIAKNDYLSNAEKEYRYQLALNIVLRWQKQRDTRRVLLITVLKNPLMQLQDENRDLQDDIDRYRHLAKQFTFDFEE